MRKFTVLSACFGLAVVATAAVGCGGKVPDEESKGSQTAIALNAATTLNTRISESIEIDQKVLGSAAPEDANLFVGNDPADGTASFQVPGAGPWADWNDLGTPARIANHRLLDLSDSKGRDPSSFPRSNECVGPSQVLSKMDLTYIAAANNGQYAYFGVQRANNNGDAGYYWVFTKKSPKLLAQAPCQADEQRLVYDVSIGDVLLAGHFHPNGTPLLRVFKANKNENDVNAVSAVDYTNGRWTENAPALAAVAVNTTPTAPGLFGAAGVSGLKGANLDTEIFAEAAVNLGLFTGNANNCGATYYGSVITRSSGSGGTSPDLKDLAGPALFNFGSTKATATLTGSCGNGATFNATAVGSDGLPLANPQCAWQFDDGSTATTCSGNVALPPGTHNAMVTVTDPSSQCTDTQSAASATVFAPLGVKIQTVAAPQACSSMTSDAVTYKSVATGGSGNYTHTWNGPGCSGDLCTIDPPDGTFCFNASFTVSVSDPVCPTVTSEAATYSKVTTVTATTAP